jgi:hypothetical protein
VEPAFKSRLSPVGCVERTEIHHLPLVRNETRREAGRSVRSARNPEDGIERREFHLGFVANKGLISAVFSAMLSGAHNPEIGERVGVLISGGNTTAVNFEG